MFNLSAKSMFKYVTVLFAVTLLAVITAGCGSADKGGKAAENKEAVPDKSAKVIEWKLQSLYPASDLSTSLQAQKIIDKINEKHGDVLKIKLYLPGQLVPEDSMFEALSSGTLDAAVMSLNQAAGIIPEVRVDFGLPLGWKGYEQTREVYNNYGLLDKMRDTLAKKNIFYVTPLPSGPLAVLGNFSVNSIEDFKGKKLWAVGTGGSLMKKLGATPVVFPPAEIYTGLKTGTIDGALYTVAELESANYKDVVKNVILPGVIDPLNVDFVVNLKKWNELPADVQNSIKEMMKELPYTMAQEYLDANNKAIEVSKQAGVKVTTLSDTEVEKMRNLAYEVWDELGKSSPNAGETVGIVKKYLKDKGVIKN